MNPVAFIGKLFSADLSPEEKRVLWKLVANRGWQVFLIGFVAFSLNWLQALGIEGFVRAGQMTTIEADMAAVKNELISKRKQELPKLILDATQSWCAASGDAKRLRLESLDALRSEYHSLMGREFERVQCSDLQ